MKNKKLLSSTGLIAIALILVLVNLIAGLVFKSTRLDMTENKLYTLSDGTRNILAKLDEPITLRLYFSEKMFSGVPRLQSYGLRVKELLDEYSDIAGDKIKLVVADPEPFSDEEDQAVKYGLQALPLDAGGTSAYLGLVATNTTDEQEVVPFLAPDKEESLEYDLTKLVYKLSNPKKRTVGIIAGLPVDGDIASNPFAQQSENQGLYIVSQMRQTFNVRSLETSIAAIPEGIDVLLLIHPKDLSDQTLFAVDQFVMKGGRVIAFVDPYAESDNPVSDPQNPMAAMTAPRASNLDKLFASWGVELVPGKIAVDRSVATRVTARGQMGVQAVDYIAWLTLTDKNVNHDDFVTADIKKLTLGTSGILKKRDGATTDFLPLLQTTDKAMELPTNRIQFGPDPFDLLRNYQPGTQALVMAARISGKVKSAFPEGITADTTTKSGLKESKDAANIIVVADTDILQDRFWVEVQNFFGNRIAFPRANNDVFVLNAVDNLSGNNDLISLRSRGTSARPFDKVNELKQEAEAEFRDKEKALQTKLRETESRLAELQRQKDGGSAQILSPEQRREIEEFRSQQVQTRKELRNVQHHLNQNIESLGAWLKFLNITLVPMLMITGVIVFSLYRNKRIKAGFATKG